MSKKFVVIGASAASMSFISKLRSFESQSQIICFSGESNVPYNRCLLADFLEKDKTSQDIQLKNSEFFTEHAVDLRLNSWVTAIDRENKTVTVHYDHVESYDYLFVGTGTCAYIPKISGTDLQGVFGFHTFASVDKLDTFIHDMMPKTAVVVGAGINGVEAVSALVSRGLKVTLVDLYDSIMPQQVDKKVAQYIENLAKDAGVTIYKGQKVVALHKRGQDLVGRVEFESGAFLPTHCVVLATGSRVNGSLVESAGLWTEEGYLVVNESMQTSDASIYAGGDICMVNDIVSKQLVKSTTWADAMLQGLTAATQFSDTPRIYPGAVGMRDSFFFGLEFYACGQTIDVDMFEVVQNHRVDYQHTFYLFDGILKGFVLIGCTENLATYRTLYLTQQAVEVQDLLI